MILKWLSALAVLILPIMPNDLVKHPPLLFFSFGWVQDFVTRLFCSNFRIAFCIYSIYIFLRKNTIFGKIYI